MSIAEARRDLRETNWKKVGYTPNPHQAPIHEDLHRVKLIAGGEGAGKSYVTAAEALGLYPAWRLCYIVGPKYQSCRPEFDYLAAWLTEMKETDASMISAPASGAASLKTKSGCILQTITAEDGPNAITGTGKSPDLILMVEAGKVSYDIYLACRNRIGRTKGIMIISGTFEGSEGWYPEFFERWRGDNVEGAVSFSLPTWTNLARYPGGYEDSEIQLLKVINPEDIFNERFGAIPNKPSTLVFRDFSYPEHVRTVPYWLGDPEWVTSPVEIAVDPGYAGAYAILAIQRQHHMVYVIDEVYRRHTVTEQMIQICRDRPWWPLWKGGVIDIAARQHAGLPSVAEEWMRITGKLLEYNRVGIVEGIRRTRTFLKDPVTGQPFLIFDPRCKETIWEFTKGYKYQEMVEGRPIREEPIDANNHACKAIAYYLYAKYGPADVGFQKLKKTKKPSPWRKILHG